MADRWSPEEERPYTPEVTLDLTRERLARSRAILDDLTKRLEAGPDTLDAPADAGPDAP
jgi:hypothetical protein